jgi:nicotinamidase-related amidase
VSGHTRYILLTECLQNDFLLNRECRLYLGDAAALGMLAGRGANLPPPGGGRLKVSRESLERGPLGVFLEAVIDRRRRSVGDGTLHVINIRDWHEPGTAYDRERRAYGNHCERGTWGAGYVEGLERYLDPAGHATGREAVSFVEGSVRVCHIHADSVFDFRPRTSDRRGRLGKLPVTELEDILDILVQGRDEEVAAADDILARGVQLDSIHEVAKTVETQPELRAHVYVAVIGVYSDIKVLTLLGGLLARYDLSNLAVSDTLTSSPTLERHISGLDFAAKVMQVEVVHGVNDLVRYVGGTPPLEREAEIVPPDGFAQYQTFFKDKQSVLAYQSEKLQDYLVLTERRAINTYNWIERSNLFLIGWGTVFLVATLVFAIWSAIDPSQVSWAIPAITGGLGLAQLVTAFFTQPMKDLQRNLMNLTTYRMVLESHSLKMALARFHLTTPHTLREIHTESDSEEATRQVQVLERELEAIRKADEVDYGALKSLRIGPEEQQNGEEAKTENGPADVDGQAPKKTPEQAAISATDERASTHTSARTPG